MNTGTKNWLSTVFVVVAGFLAVFAQAAFTGVRHLLGGQIDLLPALMVYAALRTSLVSVAVFAFLGGIWFDALSANPLGVTVLPLFLVGLGISIYRELILREQFFAQLALGAGASAAVPVLVLLLLLTTGQKPLVGWGTAWQLLIMIVAGTAATPALFMVFGFLHRLLGHQGPPELSFRPDREIRRGR